MKPQTSSVLLLLSMALSTNMSVARIRGNDSRNQPNQNLEHLLDQINKVDDNTNIAMAIEENMAVEEEEWRLHNQVLAKEQAWAKMALERHGHVLAGSDYLDDLLRVDFAYTAVPNDIDTIHVVPGTSYETPNPPPDAQQIHTTMTRATLLHQNDETRPLSKRLRGHGSRQQ